MGLFGISGNTCHFEWSVAEWEIPQDVDFKQSLRGFLVTSFLEMTCQKKPPDPLHAPIRKGETYDLVFEQTEYISIRFTPTEGVSIPKSCFSSGNWSLNHITCETSLDLGHTEKAQCMLTWANWNLYIVVEAANQETFCQKTPSYVNSCCFIS